MDDDKHACITFALAEMKAATGSLVKVMEWLENYALIDASDKAMQRHPDLYPSEESAPSA